MRLKKGQLPEYIDIHGKDGLCSHTIIEWLEGAEMEERDLKIFIGFLKDLYQVTPGAFVALHNFNQHVDRTFEVKNEADHLLSATMHFRCENLYMRMTSDGFIDFGIRRSEDYGSRLESRYLELGTIYTHIIERCPEEIRKEYEAKHSPEAQKKREQDFHTKEKLR